MLGLMDKSQQELAEALQGAPVPIHWVDGDGIVLWANDAELALLGYASSEYIGRSIVDFHADKRHISDLLARLKAGEQVSGEPAVVLAKGGREIRVVIDSNAYCVDDVFVHTRCFTRLVPLSQDGQP